MTAVAVSHVPVQLLETNISVTTGTNEFSNFVDVTIFVGQLLRTCMINEIKREIPNLLLLKMVQRFDNKCR